MPIVQLYQFTTLSRGITYTVLLDPDTLVIWTQHVPQNQPVDTIVAQSDINPRVPGENLWSTCEGFTQIQARVSVRHPFAVIVRNENSPACGYVPNVCNWTKISFTYSPETQAGARNGNLVINHELDGSKEFLEYSLDNIHWQKSNTYINLIPGNYRFWVRSTQRPDCVLWDVFTIQPGGVVEEIPFPFRELICYGFRLIHPDGTVFPIREPIQWDKVNIKGTRSKTFHGWKSQYSDGQIELGFDCDRGLDIIETEYQNHGSDALLYFEYGFTYNGNFQVLFGGKLNFNTRKRFRSWVNLSIESEEFNDLFESRTDAAVSMTETMTPDGIFISPPQVRTVNLHSKELSRMFKVDNPTVIDYPVFSFREARSFIFPDTTSTIANEIETVYPKPLEIMNDAPFDMSLYDMKLKYRGSYSFDIEFTIDVKMKGGGARGPGKYELRRFFVVNDTKTQIEGVISGEVPDAWITVPVRYKHVVPSKQYSPEDEIYWFIELKTEGFVEGPSLTQKGVKIVVEALETASGSSSRGWVIRDVLNHLLYHNTNGRTSLVSSFFSEQGSLQAFDGGGSLYVITNGKQLRNFDVERNPLKWSWKDAIETARSIFCVGYGFEYANGLEYLRVERVNYFYQNRKILQIDETLSYSEDVATEFLYNEHEFGYNIFEEEGSNVLDEFNTRKEVLAPIKTNKLKFVAKSPAIASGYTIERVRRAQYSETPSDSVDNDDEAFIISVIKGGLNGLSYVSETNQPFDVVSNVISPATAYNLRITPSRMQLNWSIWLRNAYHFKQPVEILKTTKVVQNGALETRFKAAEQRVVGDINRALVREDANIDLGSYDVEERIYRPEWINFTAKIPPDQIIKLNKALRGGLTNTENYGFIAVKDNDGLYQAGFPYELDYNFSTEEARVKLLKKFESPIDPEEECCNYLAINGCRVLINGQKVTIK